MKEFEQNAFSQSEDADAPVEGTPLQPAFTPARPFESAAPAHPFEGGASVQPLESAALVQPLEPGQTVPIELTELSGSMMGTGDGDNADDAGIGHPRVRRICRAAHVDLREARVSRWTDTVDLLTQRAPQYLQPFLAYAEG
jgi:hypothetical protein